MAERDDQIPDESAEGGSRAGPMYDALLKGMFEGDLSGACRVLGVAVKGEPEALSAEFTLTTRKMDLLARVGPAQLMHVEYARRATSDLVPRMLVYRGLIMKRYPKHHLSQHIVVLGEGTVDGHDDFAENDFAVNLRLLYLRDADPDRFVPAVNFAPLAMLHRGDQVELEQVAAGVVGAILAHGGDRIGDLLECVSVLSLIASDRRIVEKIIEEAEMAVETMETVAAFYRDTRLGRKLRAEAREELLAALLVERFGEDPKVAGVAHRLASWENSARAAHAITTATSLQDLEDPEDARDDADSAQ